MGKAIISNSFDIVVDIGNKMGFNKENKTDMFTYTF